MKRYLFVFLALFASSSVGQTVSQDRLVESYAPLAGSQSNAESLVAGLRDGEKVTLKSGSRTSTFTPPTGKMGIGNVDHALALAEASLKDQGIVDPTPEQLKAALMGGTIRTRSGEAIKVAGVLQMRADGMGWGRIANELGFRLGDVKSAGKRPDGPQRVSVEKLERPARAERVERFEKPVRPARPEKPERPGR